MNPTAMVKIFGFAKLQENWILVLATRVKRGAYKRLYGM
jgi:hypothetical protein